MLPVQLPGRTVTRLDERLDERMMSLVIKAITGHRVLKSKTLKSTISILSVGLTKRMEKSLLNDITLFTMTVIGFNL